MSNIWEKQNTRQERDERYNSSREKLDRSAPQDEARMDHAINVAREAVNELQRVNGKLDPAEVSRLVIQLASGYLAGGYLKLGDR